MSQSIILTGCSRGIGLAIAHYLLKQPAQHKILAIARSAGPLEELKTQYPGQVEVLSADLSDFSVGAKAAKLATEKFGRIDALILNHGVLDPITRLEDAKAEDWRKAFDVNFFSCVSFIQAAIPSLRHTHGRVVMTSSGAATGAYGSWGAYGAGKAAMNHLAMTLGAEEKDITTLSIRPGVVATNMQVDIRAVHSKKMAPEEAKKFHELHETGKLLTPEQPGHVIAKLALRAPKELSGQFLSWDSPELADYQE